MKGKKNKAEYDLFILEVLTDNGFVLNSMSINEYVYQKENVQITVSKL